jgi:DNA-binding MarR family transcriptional regulator
MFEVFELLSRVNVQMIKKLSPVAKAHNISIMELVILWKIDKKGPYRVTDVAREVGVPPSTLTGVFDRLEAAGYLERTHDSKDRRSVLIKVTPQLRELLESVIKEADRELTNLFDAMPPGYIDRLTQDLLELQTHLSQKVADKRNE